MGESMGESMVEWANHFRKTLKSFHCSISFESYFFQPHEPNQAARPGK